MQYGAAIPSQKAYFQAFKNLNLAQSLSPITVYTTVQAPLEKVWQYFTMPAHISQWYFASPDWHAPAAESDLRAGGTFKIRMEAKDGSFGFDFEGVYTAVQTLAQIDYAMSDGRAVCIRFEETAAGVLVTETFDPETENPIDMQRSGWQMILDNFKQHVEAA